MAVQVSESSKPVVVVDNAKVTYRVYASGKAVQENIDSRVKRQGNLRTVEAIKGVSMIAYQGDVIGVIGTNGSGKTSLMKAISGLTPLDGGKIFASSRPSFLGVGAAMLKELSGEKNIILGGLAMGYSRSEIKSKLDDIIEFSGLKEFIELPMRTYSAGMSERLKFSIAASREHDILIIDEALAVGDSKFRKRSAERMKELAKNAGCVFLVSHSLKTILETCNRAIWLDDGVLRADGEALDVCRAYAEEVGADLDD
jgi:teichoic acid transport system ATP-binding protein